MTDAGITAACAQGDVIVALWPKFLHRKIVVNRDVRR